MKRYTAIILTALLSILTMKVLFGHFMVKERQNIMPVEDSANTLELSKYDRTLRKDIFSLMISYPEYIVDIEITDNNLVNLILKSGRKVLYDDFLEKTEEEKLENPDLQDMMEQVYIIGSIDTLMPLDYNPGRIRVYPLLMDVYGSTQFEIEKNLTGVRINSTHHRFNKNNQASDCLNKAISELEQMSKTNPEFWEFLYPVGGTYNYRHISRTSRLSAHSFGISIDLASNRNDYWQWTTRELGELRLKNYPPQIVEVMENNFFIWGGKWGQFDILHFEYRPEIVIKGLYFGSEHESLWYENLPLEDERVMRIVLLIDERLKGLSY